LMTCSSSFWSLSDSDKTIDMSYRYQITILEKWHF
jgi:hypothetical protein